MEPTPVKENIYVRPMNLGDIQAVCAIDVASFTMPWPAKSYRFELTQNPAAALWVAEAKRDDNHKRVVGMIATWFVIDEVHIATLAVHPDYRRHGVGARLLAHGILHSVAKGARTAMLEVRRGNLGAQTLYQAFGFEVVGVRPHYYQDNNEDALLMDLHPIKIDFLRQIDLEPAS